MDKAAAPFPLKRLGNRSGAALVEFALLLPILVSLLIGMVAYGEYFLIAHGTQQLANDAARATLAGLTASERSMLASNSVRASLGTVPIVTPDRITQSITESGGRLVVTVQVDASRVPLLGNTFIPMPSRTIIRTAATHPGGTP